eukprot:COSAG02_NODE_52_length_44175_cov_97.989654_3_plen_82_part_00
MPVNPRESRSPPALDDDVPVRPDGGLLETGGWGIKNFSEPADDTGHKALCPVSLSRSSHTIGGVPVILCAYQSYYTCTRQI